MVSNNTDTHNTNIVYNDSFLLKIIYEIFYVN